MENNDIGNRIRTLRKKLNLSQAKFAKNIYISNGYIAALELGKQPINERIIKLICITFNVSEKWLKNGEGDIFNININKDIEYELAYSIYQQLNPEYQEYVMLQIKQLLEIQNKK